MNIYDSIATRTGGNIYVGGVTYNKHHTHCICANKLCNQIRNGINFDIFTKVTDKRGKSKHDNIVRSEHR